MKDNIIAAWDVGGSHLKLALLLPSGSNGGEQLLAVKQWPMPIWHGLEVLRDTFAVAMEELPAATVLHVASMTAELVDIFPDRIKGVLQLTAQLCALPGLDNLYIYCSDGMVKAKTLLTETAAARAASANWRPTLAYVAAHVERGVLLDIGGTTTDILSFATGRSMVTGQTDRERLASGELIYSGVVRTPVAAICSSAPIGGRMVRLCREYFADMADVYRFLGKLQPAQDLQTTADGRAKDMRFTGVRLARMAGTDSLSEYDLQLMAHWIYECQLRDIDDALMQVMSCHKDNAVPLLVAAGAGSFLVHELASRHAIACVDISSLFQSIDTAISTATVADCASAVALAYIAAAGK